MKFNENNFFLTTDSYKLSHFKMFVPGTNKSYYYIESRGGKFDKVVFFGIKRYLEKLNEMFPTIDDAEEAKLFAAEHGLPFNEDGAKELVNLGYFPVRIKAVDEGTVVPVRNVLCTVESTSPDFINFEWLVGMMETRFLSHIWYSTTVSTLSYHIREVLTKYAKISGAPLEGIKFQNQDFGNRGVSGLEQAGIGGAAHLVNFVGTDTMPGITVANNTYNAGVCGYSVPAAEHSTVTPWGREGEQQAYEYMFDQFPTGILSIVCDSYDVYNAVDQIFGVNLHDRIMNREGVTVLRPDSGIPREVLFGEAKPVSELSVAELYQADLDEWGYVECEGEYYCLDDAYCKTGKPTKVVDPVELREVKGLFTIMWERFGGTVNDKGYKVLDPHVRVLQGDGMNFETVDELMAEMVDRGWSTENIVIGMGGKLLQGVDRDVQKFAMKCSYIEVNGIGREVYKDPITDKGKSSKRGILSLVKEDGEYRTVQGERSDDLLKVVYENGNILTDITFDQIRKNAWGDSF